MTWKPLNLARKDGHPEPGQLCVIGRIWRGSAGPARREYMVGRFHLDPQGSRIPQAVVAAGRLEHPGKSRHVGPALP